MSLRVRAAGQGDIEALYRMAKSTGGGFTNLPPDRATLERKLGRAQASYARAEDVPGDDLFVFILEDAATGEPRGTCQVFSQVGATFPFYSYRLGAMTQHSKELGRTFRAEMLQLTTDLDGASEVGGLFLLADQRAAGIGKLLARSRYLFMAMHRGRFAARTIAELRGAIDDTGNSAFWDGVAGRFFGMSFREADEFNAANGNQFIADLMPKQPIYTALLADSAIAAIGVPHVSGRAAMRMLETEGFVHDCYIDIFDGGPTMVAATDRLATIRAARHATVTAIDADDGAPTDATGAPRDDGGHLVASGRLASFRATRGIVREDADGVALDAAAAALLGIGIGANIVYVPG